MRSFSTYAAVVAALAIVAIAATGGAVAQEANTTANNVTDHSPPGYEERLDSQIVIVEWSWSDSSEHFSVTFENQGDRPTQVTIVESVQAEEGASQIAFARERLLPGETTINIPVTPRAGEAAIAISSRESMEEQTGIILSTGVYSPGPWTATTPGAGWAGGISVMTGMLVAAAYKRMKETHDAPEAL